MSILKNAIDSIELGVEDYKSNQPKRLLSAVRNYYAGILLLFKYKLALLSQDNDEALLKKKVLPVKVDGKVLWKGIGKNTVDFQQIKERFNSLEIEVDWKQLEKAQKYRNNIEHYYDTANNKPDVVRQYISACFIIIRNFILHNLDEDPKSLFDPNVWEILVEERQVYEAEKKACCDALEQLEWPSDLTLGLFNEFACTGCGSDLIGLSDNYFKDASLETFLCRVCSTEWCYDELLRLVCEKEAEGDYGRIADGGDAMFAYCPECSEEYYHTFEGTCVNCGAKGPYYCDLCGCEIPDCELSLYQDENVCTWCWQVRMKDD